MPRYFFHTCDGAQDIDKLGHELADDTAARCEAIRYAGGLLADDPDIINGDEALRINVTNEEGRLSCSIIILAVDASWTSSDQPEPIVPTAISPRE
ncbi:DUF6894 family protein [Sphingopyxis fribergensis]